MKRIIKNIIGNTKVMAYLQYFKEIRFPSDYQKESLNRLKIYEDFYSQFISKNDLCFDIGAHRGHRTNVFLNLGANVLAVEPQKDCFNYLWVKYRNKATIKNLAVGAKKGFQHIYISNESSLSTLSDNWIQRAKEGRFKETIWKNKKKIEVTTLDSLISDYGMPKFCKIDVEGYEAEVLKGLSKPIEYISIEYMVPENIEIIKEALYQQRRVSPEIQVNYSAGDTMELVLPEWLPFDEALNLIGKEEFVKTGWGDIYIRSHS